MKLKEIDRTATVAWSPIENHGIYLAAGTAAQQLDCTFNSNAVLELYFFDINLPGLDVPVNASLECENRFYKIAWGSHGMLGTDIAEAEYPSGIIVGGCDNGIMNVYDVAKILRKEEPIILTKNKHTGPVRALDFNSFRSNIVASGASDSEILIWDLNNPKTAMTPGPRSQPGDDVTSLAWNKQVEHILASSFSNRCVMWDLRKNEPIIKVADSTSRVKYVGVEWHPSVATQLCLASDDETNPTIQLWDLRYATSPIRVMMGHQRGVMGLSWCQQDPELLVSCGKDNTLKCWNPNYPHQGYELVAEIPTTSQWSFDVAFCPRNPLVIASSSFDGRVSIFGLSGGAQQAVTSSKLADSFPGMDMTLEQTPVPAQKPMTVQLRDAPKWLKRPCGASFAFGGKLIKFENVKAQLQPGQQQPGPDSRLVTISQVVTLPDFLAKSQTLESALASGSLGDFCEQKAVEAVSQNDSKIWRYLKANFSQDPVNEYLLLLGYEPTNVSEKLKNAGHRSGLFEDMQTVTAGMETLMQGDSFGRIDSEQNLLTSSTEDTSKPFPIPTKDDFQGQLNQALLTGNIESAVGLCVDNEEWSEALILASFGNPDLFRKVQRLYFKENTSTSEMIRLVVNQDWIRLVQDCELSNWEQALATILTYVRNESEFAQLAGLLGQRLQASGDDKNAMICYICSGDMDKLAQGWASSDSTSDAPDSLQNLVEHITILRKAAEARGKYEGVTTGPLASKMVEYATLLASQGSLDSALKYLADATDPSMVQLRERIQYALGYQYQKPRGIHPRSRQTSESSGGASYRGSLSHKRPSYSSGPSYGSPPSQMLNGYGSNYGTSQVTQPPPPQTYVPTPPKVQTLLQPSKPPQPSPPSSSMPLPPVSNVAHGWNDPPTLSTVVKSKPPKVVDKVDSITHPLFTPALPSNTGFGSNTAFAPSAPPPPSSFMPPTPLNVGHTQQSVPLFPATGSASQSSLPPPPSQSSYPPPTMSGNMGSHSQSGYSSMGSHSSYGSSGNTGMQSTYGAPGGGGYGSGASAPPPQSAPLPPPPSGGFKPASLQSLGIQRSTLSGIASSTSSASGYGSGYSSGGYGSSAPGGYSSGQPVATFTPGPPQSMGGPSTFTPGPPPPANSFSAGLPPSGYSGGPPPSTGFSSGQPSPGGYNAGPPGTFSGPPSNSTAGPPPSSMYTPAPPPTSGFNYGQGANQPPNAYSGGPPPSMYPLGPPTSTFAPAPATSTFIPGPPTSTFNPGPPTSGFPNNFPPPYTPLPSSSFDAAGPPPPVSSFSSTQPPASHHAGLPPAGPPRPPSVRSATPSNENLLMSAPDAGATITSNVSLASATNTAVTSTLLPSSEAQLPPHSNDFLSSFSTSNSGVTLQPVSPRVETASEALSSNQPFSPNPLPTKSPSFSDSNFGQGDSNIMQTAPPPFLPPPPIGMNTQVSPSATPPMPASSPMRPDAISRPGGDVPEEHQELLDVIERLRQECVKVAGLPQIKRKLEDVSRKIENLKEKLQSGSLSPSTLHSLHEMIDAMKNREYPAALNIHTRMCTSGNFAEISSFSPAIKVLITSAAQLNVFL